MKGKIGEKYIHTCKKLLKVYYPFQTTGTDRFVFQFFFTSHRGRPQSKQEFTINHSQHPIARCGPNQGEPDTSPSRILLRLLYDTLLLQIGLV